MIAVLTSDNDEKNKAAVNKFQTSQAEIVPNGTSKMAHVFVQETVVTKPLY